MEKTLLNYYYYRFIMNKGDQEGTWKSIIHNGPDTVDDGDVERLAKERIDFLHSEFSNKFVNICETADVGKVPGTIGSDFLDNIGYFDDDVAGEDVFYEWMGDFLDFNGKDAILVDDWAAIQLTWLKELAEKNNIKICSVMPITYHATFPGAGFVMVVYNPGSSQDNKMSYLFGTKEDCWRWASKISFTAFASGCAGDKLNELFIVRAESIQNFAELYLAVPGNAGCDNNKLIKSGWKLADCVSDVQNAIDLLKKEVD